jgi:hypothetical protein
VPEFPTGGGYLGEGAPGEPAAPFPSSPPTITGIPVVGNTLTGYFGVWTGSPSSITGQWQRDNHGGGVYSDIPGATGLTYLLTVVDDSCQIRLAVTAVNAGGGTVAGSNVLSVTEPPPVNTVPPAITGALQVGQVLTCTTGTWLNMGGVSSYAFRWQRDNFGGGTFTDIPGAVGAASSYSLTDADDHCQIRCRVTATNSGGSLAVYSNTVGLVLEPGPVNTVAPVAAGAVVGVNSTVTNGTWLHMAGEVHVFTYQWQRSPDGVSWSSIGGGDHNIYRPSAGDNGFYLRCQVTATNDGGSATANSNSVGPISGAVIAGSLRTPAWRYVLCDANGVSLGELRAYQRTLSVGISQTATATCVIREVDPLWTTLQTGPSRLKVYDSAGNLRFFGPVISDEETAEGGGASVKITAADLSFELAHRFIARDIHGISTTFLNKRPDQIVSSTLSSVNGDRATGISMGSVGSFIKLPTVSYLWKPALDIIVELAGIDGSYEWLLRYVDGAAGAAPTVYLDLPSVTGSDLTTSVFLGYGSGKRNCSAYSRVRTVEQMATVVWAIGSGSTRVQSAHDTGAESTYNCRREDVLNFQDIQTNNLLDALATAHVNVRSVPRSVVVLTPLPNTLRYGVDYVFGDTLTGHVTVGGQVRVNGPIRIWAADVDIDDDGQEVPTLHTVPS